ncbi:tol-pal system protein YbgF [Reinekea forsetii]|nr:tol-pal system protein YbgF [Reinekea forsetii]
MQLMYKRISAALMGGTFAFMSAQLWADVPIVQSQADHVAQSQDAVPLNRQTTVAAADNAVIESLLFQVQDLQSMVAEQRGLIEELHYQVQVLQQEQKERYVDLDRRILSLQEQRSTVQASPVAATNNAPDDAALSDEEILAQYNQAKDLMRERDFDKAIAQLSVFTKQYPQHPLTPNSWYWIGEIYLVQRDTASAQKAFERIVKDYSDHDKTPDSLYKLGVIAQQSGNAAKAADYFNRVIKEYADTQSAKLAKARLEAQ